MRPATWLDRFFGRGPAAVTVPVMDGPLKPNRRLEDAERLLTIPAIDNLLATGAGLWCSAGADLLTLDVMAPTPAAALAERMAAEISCLAAADDGTLAVGLDGLGVSWRRPDGRWQPPNDAGGALRCPTAALFLDERTLIVANGSAEHPAGHWQHDLMKLGRSGSLWAIDVRTSAATRIIADLEFPYGLARHHDGRLLVSESWRHRIVSLDPAGKSAPRPVLARLPAYPSRIAAASDGGYWLALFAPRSQLTEFVLREDDYRQQMMAEIPSAAWLGPALSSAAGIDTPLQAGTVRQMGVLKPWAPSRSGGLVVRCDHAMLPRDSLHSRADGAMHGVTAMCEHLGSLLIAAKGAGMLLRVPLGVSSSPEAAR